MKKYISVILCLVLVLSLGGCAEKKSFDPNAETAEEEFIFAPVEVTIGTTAVSFTSLQEYDAETEGTRLIGAWLRAPEGVEFDDDTCNEYDTFFLRADDGTDYECVSALCSLAGGIITGGVVEWTYKAVEPQFELPEGIDLDTLTLMQRTAEGELEIASLRGVPFEVEEEEAEEAAESETGNTFTWHGRVMEVCDLIDNYDMGAISPQEGKRFVRFNLTSTDGLLSNDEMEAMSDLVRITDSTGTEYGYSRIVKDVHWDEYPEGTYMYSPSITAKAEYECVGILLVVSNDVSLDSFTVTIEEGLDKPLTMALTDIPVGVQED